MKNNYEICGDVTIIFIKGKGKVHETIIDTFDLPIADSFTGTWFASQNSDTLQFYVYGADYKSGKSTIQLHRCLFDNPKGKVIDHKNHNTLDNRRSNLRECINSENLQNRKGATSVSKSGVLGVTLHRGKWRAVVTLNGKPKHIGYYKNIADAEVAVKQARKERLPFSKEALTN
jgi:hypothetical protein